MRLTSALLALLLLASCTDDPANPAAPDMTATPGDMTADLTPDPSDQGDDLAAPDMNTPDLIAEDMPTQDMSTLDMNTPDMQVDMSSDMTSDMEVDQPVDMAPQDMASVEDMMVAPDMAPDMMTPQDPYVGRPTGQCDVSGDCGAEGSCSRTAPGGICNGPPSICEALPGSYSANFGACQRDCSDTDDCPPGLTCNGQGVCIIQRCAANVCPTPLFGCTQSGLCTRVDCSAGQTCPGGTTCTRGLCIEDRELN
jgi:hypothetical protein